MATFFGFVFLAVIFLSVWAWIGLPVYRLWARARAEGKTTWANLYANGPGVLFCLFMVTWAILRFGFDIELIETFREATEFQPYKPTGTPLVSSD